MSVLSNFGSWGMSSNWRKGIRKCRPGVQSLGLILDAMKIMF